MSATIMQPQFLFQPHDMCQPQILDYIRVENVRRVKNVRKCRKSRYWKFPRVHPVHPSSPSIHTTSTTPPQFISKYVTHFQVSVDCYKGHHATNCRPQLMIFLCILSNDTISIAHLRHDPSLSTSMSLVSK